MSLLAAHDIQAMRKLADESLNAEAVIQKASYAPDGAGGGTTAWTPAGTVACRLAPLSGAERVMGERLGDDSTVVFTFPAGTDIDHNSQIVYAGGTFSVSDVPRRSLAITQRVVANPVE